MKKIENRAKIQGFEDLIVWQRAHQLMLDTYTMIKLLPKEEEFNRKSQLRRSVSSIAANIAEGFGRFHYQENLQFCRQARGSLTETKNHIVAARDLGQASRTDCAKLIHQCNDLLRLLNAYIRSTRAWQGAEFREKLEIGKQKIEERS